MSDNITGSWKKKLQTFLKGNGKLNTNSFKDKAIVVKLQGGNVEVVDRYNKQDFLKR